MFKTITLETEFGEAFDVTPALRELITESGIKDGLAVLQVPYTTAGLVLHSFWDPRGWKDMMIDLDRAIPPRIDYRQKNDNPYVSAAVIKSSIVGTTLTVIIKDGTILFGRSQGILFAEFEKGCTREVHVKLMDTAGK